MRKTIRTSILVALTSIAVAGVAIAGNDSQRRQKQAELDARCDAARQEMIKPLKEKYIAECIQEQTRQRDAEEYCERFYKDYGERSGRRQAMFLDLPECIEANEYQKSTRSSR